MHITCWITKATDTHSECVIVAAFPRQNGYANTISMLYHTYITCVLSVLKSVQIALEPTQHHVEWMPLALLRGTESQAWCWQPTLIHAQVKNTECHLHFFVRLRCDLIKHSVNLNYQMHSVTQGEHIPNKSVNSVVNSGFMLRGCQGYRQNLIVVRQSRGTSTVPFLDDALRTLYCVYDL